MLPYTPLSTHQLHTSSSSSSSPPLPHPLQRPTCCCHPSCPRPQCPPPPLPALSPCPERRSPHAHQANPHPQKPHLSQSKSSSPAPHGVRQIPHGDDHVAIDLETRLSKLVHPLPHSDFLATHLQTLLLGSGN